MWKGGGLQAQKVRGDQGEVLGMEPRWQHGMDNKTKQDNVIQNSNNICFICLRLSFHVGFSSTIIQIRVGWRCSHVANHKLPSKHTLAVRQNVEVCRHMPLDFHVPTKEILTYKCRSLKNQDWLKTQKNHCWSRTPFLVTGRRRLVGGPGFEKMGVASWHKQTLPHQIPSTFGWVYSYSHQNLVGEWSTWKLTLKALHGTWQHVMGIHVCIWGHGHMVARLQGCMGVLGLSPFGILNHMGGYNGPGWHMSKVGYIQYGKK